MVFTKESSIFGVMSTYNHLLVEHPHQHVAQLLLNRPEAANALNTQMATELQQFFSKLPPQQTRVVILSGAGRHFCAGADLKERKGMNENDWKTQHKAFRDARDTILYCPLPVIAAVNGAAYGGGLELALACDFIYAAKTANFALTEATLGIMPGMGGTQTLPRAAGNRRAKELLFAGKRFSAAEAFEWGIVNKLYEANLLLEKTIACADSIANSAPLSVQAIKRSVNDGAQLPLSDALELELALYNKLLSTDDRKEGINAYNDKRKPDFSGG